MKKVDIKIPKEIPQWIDKNYPDWRRNLWGALRAFVGGFLGTTGVLLVVTPKETFLSWDNFQNWLIPLVAGALAGGFVAVGKFLRDLFPDSKTVNKMPI